MTDFSSYKPNTDSDVTRLTGVYQVTIHKAQRETGKWPSGDPRDQFVIGLTIEEVLDGNGRAGMFVPFSNDLQANYDDADRIKRNIIDGLAQAGLLEGFNYASEEEIEKSLPTLVGKTCFGRAFCSKDEKYQNWRFLTKEKAYRRAGVEEGKGAGVPF